MAAQFVGLSSTFDQQRQVINKIAIDVNNILTGEISLNLFSVTGVSTFFGIVNFVDSVFLGDNTTLFLGNSNDLRIFHDGSDSNISDIGSGNLVLDANGTGVIIKKFGTAENMGRFLVDSAVELYYNNSKKIETTGYGVTIFDTLHTQQLNISGISTLTTLNSTNGSITNLTGTAGTVTNFNSTNGTITNLTGTAGTVTNFNSTNASITNLTGTAGTITNLNSISGIITNLTGTAGTITTLNSTNGTITNLTGTSGTITTLNSTNGSITNLTGTAGTITTLNSTNGTITNLTGTSGTITTLNSTNGTITNLTGTSGTITTLNSTNGTITNLTGTAGTITTLNSTNGSITNLTGTSGTITNLTGTAGTITTLNSTNVNLININSSGISTLGVTSATILTAQQLNVSGIITSSSFVKTNGTSSQFLKADGSIDSSVYATQTYVGLATAGLASTDYVNNAIVGFITSGALSGYTTEGYVNTQVGLATSGLLSSTGSGSSLTGIVTSIVAGTGITISGSTGQVVINSTVDGGTNYWSQTNVGINTLSNVGIGTTNPTTNLYVQGDAIVTGILSVGQGTITLNGNTDTLITPTLNVGVGGTIITTTGIGSVGIGSTQPSSTLTVNINGSVDTFTGNVVDVGYVDSTLGRRSIFQIAAQSFRYDTTNSGAKTAFRFGSFTSNTGWVGLHYGVHPNPVVYQTSLSTTTGVSGVNNTGYFAWTSGTYFTDYNSWDLRLYRDTSGVLAQRNGTNAQTSRIYNTYTSATNFERANVGWTTNTFIVGTEKGVDGGSPRQLELQTDGTTRVAITTDGYVGIGTTNPTSALTVQGDVSVSGIITSSSFVKTNGTSSQFLKADGSVDSNTYLTSESDTLDTVTTRGNTTSNGISVGVVTAQNGFTSGIGVTNPVQITVVGNIITFNVVGVGSTSLLLF